MDTNQPFDLSGKIALVTGASKGIGESAARFLCAYGATVIINSRKQDELDKTAAAIAADTGGRCVGIAANTGDMAACKALMEAIQAQFGGLDILVNNAATNPAYGPIQNAEESAYDKIMNVNVKGPFMLSNLAHPMLKARGGGAVVNISSVAGLRVDPGLGLYSITKAALIMLTKVQAKDWARDGIRVNAVCPGWIKTKMSEMVWSNEETLQRVKKIIPMGRIGSVEEIGALVLFLASPASTYMTGAVVTADGGLTL